MARHSSPPRPALEALSPPPAGITRGSKMNMTRRSLTLAGVALAATVATTASLPARASDASDAKDLVLKAQATIDQFGRQQGVPDLFARARQGAGSADLSAGAQGRLRPRRLRRLGRAAGARHQDRQVDRPGLLHHGLGQPRLPGGRLGRRSRDDHQLAEGARLALREQGQARRRCLGRDRPERHRGRRRAGFRLHRLLDGQGRFRRPGHRRLGARRARVRSTPPTTARRRRRSISWSSRLQSSRNRPRCTRR